MPTSLLDEEVVVVIQGIQYTVTLVHIHDVNFRLILRPPMASPPTAGAYVDNLEPILVDLLFNQFVLDQFFDFLPPYSSVIKEAFMKVASQQSIDNANLKQIVEENNITHELVWMVNTSEEKVRVKSDCQG